MGGGITFQASLSDTHPPNSAITGYAIKGALLILVHKGGGDSSVVRAPDS